MQLKGAFPWLLLKEKYVFPDTVDPSKTILFLGAGSSIPSGAPSGEGLQVLLAREFELQSDGFDLQETARLIEIKSGRRPLAVAVRDILKDIEPNSGVLGIPNFNWHSIYTTNFDTVLEKAYMRHGRALSRVRTDYDYENSTDTTNTILYKIHGCITQDGGFGDKANMILTERDYVDFEKYRANVFAKLKNDLLADNCLIIGYSLKDPHLRDLIRKVAIINKGIGRVNNISALVFERDDDRKSLIEDLGVSVRFGDIDSFVTRISNQHFKSDATTIKVGVFDGLLPENVIATVTDVHALNRARSSSPKSLYNGRPATYQDINAGYTSERDLENQIIGELDKSKSYATVSGAFGVGKTTLCRRICWRLQSRENGKDHVWELIQGMPFLSNDWSRVNADLIKSGKRGFLFIDEAQQHSRELKRYMDINKDTRHPLGLHLILSANHAEWSPIVKSKNIFIQGFNTQLSLLTSRDIERLVNLVDTNDDIKALADEDFRNLSISSKITRLQNRAQRDMFVCLKFIFSNDALDRIMLYEYDRLGVDLQEIYKYVSALDSMGCQVHRQLIMRVLSLDPNQIGRILEGVDGIILEFEMPNEGSYAGIFRWSTRHKVISDIIRRYKFAEQADLYRLISDLIDNINPLVPPELRTLRALCTDSGGISSIKSKLEKVSLYKELIRIAPNERLPWHRLIRLYIDDMDIEDAALQIDLFRKLIGRDPTVDRYEVRVSILKSDPKYGLPVSDRRAVLMFARERAISLIERSPDNKYVHTSWADVEFAIHDLLGYSDQLDNAVDGIFDAYTELLDPWLEARYREYDAKRIRLHSLKTIAERADQNYVTGRLSNSFCDLDYPHPLPPPL